MTDVIVRRGDRDVVRRAAGNAGAHFSQTGYSTLIKRSAQDGVLTLAVGRRDDLSDQQLKDLLAGTIDIIRRRLFEVVKPDRQVAIKQAISEITGMTEPVVNGRDFGPAQRTILALHNAGELNEGALFGFAKAHKYEESIAALSAMSGVKIATLDRLIMGDRFDPILMVSKAIGIEWATAAGFDSASVGSKPGAGSVRYRERAFEFHPPDAFDRRAGGEFLENPPIGVTGETTVIPGWSARDQTREISSTDSGFALTRTPRNDG